MYIERYIHRLIDRYIAIDAIIYICVYIYRVTGRERERERERERYTRVAAAACVKRQVDMLPTEPLLRRISTMYRTYSYMS